MRRALLLLAAAVAALNAVELVSLGSRDAGAGCTTSARGAPSGLFLLRLGHATATPIVSGLSQVDHPAVSPDGRDVAFLSDDNGIVARLAVCNLSRHTIRRVPISIPAGNFPLSWSRSGKSLVFLGGDIQGYGANQRPFLVEPSGRRLRALAGNSPWYYDGIVPSPDGTKLALLLELQDPGNQEPEQLAVLDLRTGTLRRVAGSNQVAQISGMSWSPDGTKLVFDGYRQNPRGGLYIVDVATRRLTTLLVHGAGAHAPAWSPNGRYIAFVRGGRASSIWLLDLRTDRQRRLTRGSTDLAPAWTPDARGLVFVRRPASQTALR